MGDVRGPSALHMLEVRWRPSRRFALAGPAYGVCPPPDVACAWALPLNTCERYPPPPARWLNQAHEPIPGTNRNVELIGGILGDAVSSPGIPKFASPGSPRDPGFLRRFSHYDQTVSSLLMILRQQTSIGIQIKFKKG